MSEQPKRKSLQTKDADVQGGTKKRKHDLTWLTDGLAGSEPFTVLQRFIDESNSNQSDVDVVREFLAQSGTGQEFLALLDSETKRKHSEIGIIFNSLEVIFSRIASDLNEYRSVGTKTASSILQSRMFTIYNILAPSSSAIQIKSALRLLTSMVTLGHLTAREVITRFDFTHACVSDILNHRSLTHPPDVRSTYLKFITSFLMEDDPMLLRTMAENSAILQPIFSGLKYDPVGVLRFFLTALRDMLAANPLLSKTHKVHIFNTYSLNHLASLFAWLGPHHAPNLKNSAEKDSNITKEENEEDRMAVGQLNQSLLISLISSHKLGIAFVDYSLGLNYENKNPKIFKLLTAMGNYWEHQTALSPGIIELQSQIVIKILQSCPDLLNGYFTAIYPDLKEVRVSPAWLELCSLVSRILDGQNVGVVFNPREKYSLKQQSMRASAIICPQRLENTWFVNSLTSENMSVWLAVGKILQTILEKIVEFQNILFHSSKSESYNELEKNLIFSQVKDILRRVLPSSTIVINSYLPLSDFMKEQGDALNSFSVFLELLSLYSKVGFITNDENVVPVAQIVYDVLIYIQDSTADKDLLERLQLSVFSFASSLSVFKLGLAERRALITQVICCLIKTRNTELRSVAVALLFNTMRSYGMTRLQFNVWLTVLERYPDSASAFTNLCVDFRPDEEPSSNTFLLAAWNSHQVESMTHFLSALTCELLLCDEDPQSFASNHLKSIPNGQLNPSLRTFLESWRKGQIPEDLGLNPLARIILSAGREEESSSSGWNEVISAYHDRLDFLEVVLHQCMTSMGAKSGDPLRNVQLLRDLINKEEKCSLDRILLEHASSVEWFDPINSETPFISAFSALIREVLERNGDAELNERYQRKTVGCIYRMFRGEVTLHSPDELKHKIFFSQLKMSDIEPLMTSMIDEKKVVFSECLNMCLERAARLRLEGDRQELSWPIFSRILSLFVSLKACPTLRQGIYDVMSVFPEFINSVNELTAVLNACLDSETDAARLCNFLTTSSSQLCATLGKSVADREELFRDINWRVQALPAYLSSVHDGNKVLAMLHRNLSPVVKKLLIHRTEFQRATLQMPELLQFTRILITRCWSTEECREVAVQLLTKQKTEAEGVLCSQFADVGRRGTHYDLHLKLCLRTAVHQMKSDSVNLGEMELLVNELAWLSKQAKPVHGLAEKLIGDSMWKKFAKYTLKIGLRALTEEDSALPPLALRLMISTLSLLLMEGTEEITSQPSQQIYEMVTSHSDFLSVIMDEEGNHLQQKQLLLELLTVLVSMNPKLCQGSQVPLLLASYHATRSATDRLILGLLRTYEKKNVLLSTYKPYLWGSAAAAHFSIQRGAATRLHQQPEAGEVLTLLDSDKLLNTAYRFPVRLRFNQAESNDNLQDENEEDYDPRFLLSLLAHILSPEYVVQCGRFTQTGAMSLLFASLSSSCGEMRSLGWIALSRLFDQFQNASNWPERCIWMHLIECLRLGTAEQHCDRKTHPPKLSNLITLFMAKAAAIIRDALHPMYKSINNFLMVKPVLDVTQVPEFFVLLHSTELPEQRILHRTFLLKLLRDGVKNRQDYLVCARRRVFRVLLTLLPSRLLVDKSDKMMILEVVQSVLRNPIITYDMIQNRGLIMWMDGLLLTGDKRIALQLLQMTSTLWSTLEDHLHKKRKSLDKTDDEEMVAELEKELDGLQEGDDTVSKEQKKLSQGINTHCRKPIWNMLPNQEQVIAPWIVYELIQLMIHLWGAIDESDMNSSCFAIYVKILRALASHVHESKRLIKSAQQDSKSLHFVSPCRLLSPFLLRELVDVSSRFVNNLPDIRDHLEAVLCGTSKTVRDDPVELTDRWMHRHDFMRNLTDQEERHPPIRRDLHTILSLAECGV